MPAVIVKDGVGPLDDHLRRGSAGVARKSLVVQAAVAALVDHDPNFSTLMGISSPWVKPSKNSKIIEA